MSAPHESPPAALQRVSELLAANRFDVAYQPADEDDPQELLLITATLMKGAVVPMRIQPLNVLVGLVARDTNELAPMGSWLLYGSTVFPFPVPTERMLPVLRAIQLINRTLPLCSFGLSEADGVCHLQACAPIESDEDLPRSVILDVFGMACHAAQMYGDSLAMLASGALDFDGFAAQMQSAGVMPPPLFSMESAITE